MLPASGQDLTPGRDHGAIVHANIVHANSVMTGNVHDDKTMQTLHIVMDLHT